MATESQTKHDENQDTLADGTTRTAAVHAPTAAVHDADASVTIAAGVVYCL